MKIGILNTGNIGSRLARAWVAAGHELVIAKDSDYWNLEPLLKELGAKARYGTIREAAEFGDVLLFSVYWPRAEGVLAAVGNAADGKIVIETMNPLGVTEEFVHYHDMGFMKNSSTTEFLQSRLPKAKVFKAFNVLPAPTLEPAAWADNEVKPNIFYAGDDAEAGKITRGLIEDAGFTPLNTGGIKSARAIEQLGVLVHHVANHEYDGDASLVRLGVSVIHANPGPIFREGLV
ncbi:NADPH-dependent F420 reductase [Pedobacter antarcticus]|uniref:NADPH-dependent F420 reductase n=1 Tax=Pedobacter antarcticus TaxID=34086 RepID=UPI002930D163|nr:NADPH-dependent F420 reductase [Pedobacter antarcticus]